MDQFQTMQGLELWKEILGEEIFFFILNDSFINLNWIFFSYINCIKTFFVDLKMSICLDYIITQEMYLTNMFLIIIINILAKM